MGHNMLLFIGEKMIFLHGMELVHRLSTQPMNVQLTKLYLCICHYEWPDVKTNVYIILCSREVLPIYNKLLFYVVYSFALCHIVLLLIFCMSAKSERKLRKHYSLRQYQLNITSPYLCMNEHGMRTSMTEQGTLKTEKGKMVVYVSFL